MNSHNESKTVGTKLEVWRGKARKTAGGLAKSDLIRSKSGKIVSKKASLAAQKGGHLGKHLGNISLLQK